MTHDKDVDNNNRTEIKLNGMSFGTDCKPTIVTDNKLLLELTLAPYFMT